MWDCRPFNAKKAISRPVRVEYKFICIIGLQKFSPPNVHVIGSSKGRNIRRQQREQYINAGESSLLDFTELARKPLKRRYFCGDKIKRHTYCSWTTLETTFKNLCDWYCIWSAFLLRERISIKKLFRIIRHLKELLCRFSYKTPAFARSAKQCNAMLSKRRLWLMNFRTGTTTTTLISATTNVSPIACSTLSRPNEARDNDNKILSIFSPLFFRYIFNGQK